MKELAILMASFIPREDLVKQLKDAIQTWELDPIHENFSKVETICMLIMTKTMTDKKDPMELIKEVDTVSRIQETMDNKQ